MDGVYIAFDNPNIKTIWPIREAEVQADRIYQVRPADLDSLTSLSQHFR